MVVEHAKAVAPSCGAFMAFFLSRERQADFWPANPESFEATERANKDRVPQSGTRCFSSCSASTTATNSTQVEKAGRL